MNSNYRGGVVGNFFLILSKMRIFLAIAGIALLSPLAYFFPPYDSFVGKVPWSILIFLCLILLARLAFFILDWGLLRFGVRWQRFFDYIRNKLFHYLTYGYVMSPLLRSTFTAFIIFLHPITMMFINKLFREIIIFLLVVFSVIPCLYVLLMLVWYHPEEIRRLNKFFPSGLDIIPFEQKLFFYPKAGYFDNLIALTDEAMLLFWIGLWTTLAMTYIFAMVYFIGSIRNTKRKRRRKTVRIDASIALEAFRNSVRKRLR